MRLEISGADLRAALEEGVSLVEDVAGRFPQVSGLRFVFDARRPRGSRVLEVSIGGTPPDPAATYKLATSEYVMAGGDGYASLTKDRPIVDASGASLMAAVVIDYIAARTTVTPGVEGASSSGSESLWLLRHAWRLRSGATGRGPSFEPVRLPPRA